MGSGSLLEIVVIGLTMRDFKDCKPCILVLGFREAGQTCHQTTFQPLLRMFIPRLRAYMPVQWAQY